MAKGDHFTPHQRSAINRFYEHRDTRIVTALQEAVSELYLAAGEPAAARLWKRVAKDLERTGVAPERSARIVEGRDVAGLAALVSELAGPGRG